MKAANKAISLTSIAILAGVGLNIVACSPNGDNALSPPKDKIIADQAQWLGDGAAIAYKLEPGIYKLEMTASSDGAAVEWVGTSCPGTNETKSFSVICEIPSLGQVIVKNPTLLGLGATSSVSVRITRLAR